MEQPIRSFTDLYVWKEGHKLVLDVYKTTRNFPNEERFSLTSQIRRAVVSITSNIAEGFVRQTYKDKIRFYYVALGSLIETQNQLLIARDVGYISKETFEILAAQCVSIHRILNAFIAKTKTFIPNSKFQIPNSQV